jgi:hypothetical protein
VIGILMPTKASARWIADGDIMVKVFTAKGYKTDLQYAEDDIPNQLAQIENMITKRVKVVVIAAIDGTTLSGALKLAAAFARWGTKSRPERAHSVFEAMSLAVFMQNFSPRAAKRLRPGKPHGQTGAPSSPAVSGRSQIRFAFCTA